MYFIQYYYNRGDYMEIINSSEESLNRVHVCADNYGCSTRTDVPSSSCSMLIACWYLYS